MITLSYNQAIVYEALKRTANKKKIAEMTGMLFANVSNALVFLHKKGMAKRIDKGIYRAVKKEYISKDKFNVGEKLETPDALVRAMMNINVHPTIRHYIVTENEKQTKRSVIARNVKLSKIIVNQIIAEGKVMA